jgi:hypothetical protein
MQTPGTSVAARSFCRRASRNNAEGANTDGEAMFLLSSMGGVTICFILLNAGSED